MALGTLDDARPGNTVMLVRRPTRSTMRRIVALAIVVFGLVALTATPAAAHSVLVSTDPAAGAVLTQSPDSIELDFSEPVTVALGGVRVFDERGDRVETGAPEKPDASAVRLPIRGTLPEGAYVVTYRVTSADTHPVQGAFTFQVGTAADATSREVTGLADRLLGDQEGARAVGVAWGVVRWLAFVGIALFVGGVAFCAIVWRAARDERRTRRIVGGSWILLAGATVAGFLLQGPYQAGLGFGHLVDPGLLGDVAGTRFGTVWLARLALLGVALVLVRALFARRPAAEHPLPRWWLVLAGAVGLGIVFTPAFAGHSAAGDVSALAVVVDGAHVGAMALWLGGLVMLAAVALRGDDIDEHRGAVERFSRLATACILTLIATGVFQSWREVRSLDGFKSTDFGRILLVKLVVFTFMALFAVVSREMVRRVFWADSGSPALVVSGGAVDDDAAPDLSAEELDELRRWEWGRLRRSVAVEVVLGIVVLAVTAVLVNATPSVSAAGERAGAQGLTLRSPQVVVDITVAPGVAGANDLHVSTFTAAGAPLDVADLSITFDLPSRKIAAIDVPLRKLGPSHYLSPGFVIPYPGEWNVVAKARLSDVDEVTRAGTVTIRPG